MKSPARGAPKEKAAEKAPEQKEKDCKADAEGRQKDTVFRTVRESLASSPAAWASDTEGSSMTESAPVRTLGKRIKDSAIPDRVHRRLRPVLRTGRIAGGRGAAGWIRAGQQIHAEPVAGDREGQGTTSAGPGKGARERRAVRPFSRGKRTRRR